MALKTTQPTDIDGEITSCPLRFAKPYFLFLTTRARPSWNESAQLSMIGTPLMATCRSASPDVQRRVYGFVTLTRTEL